MHVMLYASVTEVEGRSSPPPPEGQFHTCGWFRRQDDGRFPLVHHHRHLPRSKPANPVEKQSEYFVFGVVTFRVHSGYWLFSSFSYTPTLL